MAKKALDAIKSLTENTLDVVVAEGMEKVDPLLSEITALRDEIASIRKTLAASKGELTKFKKDVDSRLETISQAADRIDRIFRFLKRIPFVGKMF